MLRVCCCGPSQTQSEELYNGEMASVSSKNRYKHPDDSGAVRALWEIGIILNDLQVKCPRRTKQKDGSLKFMEGYKSSPHRRASSRLIEATFSVIAKRFDDPYTYAGMLG
jgi:hypothetical protein